MHGAREVLSALDARMAEVYWGAYVLGDNDLMQPSIDELVCAPSAVPAAGKGDWFGVGSGWQAYAQTLEERAAANLVRVLPDMQIDALDMLHLAAADFMAGRAIEPEYAIPVYLRDNVARKKAVQ